MTSIGKTVVGTVLGLLLASTGQSIIIRHDREDVRYVEWGASFSAVGVVGDRLGDGTLVAPDWVLTAAHVAEVLARRPDPTVLIEGRPHNVREVFLHPDWEPMGRHDLALLALERPVAEVAPLPLCRGGYEVGRTITIVGHGVTGDGRSSSRREDGLRRAATNRIVEIDDTAFVFAFDPPPGGLDLEGTPGPGDSGGPAIVGEGAAACVLGVSSLGYSGPEGPGSYGARDLFGRVDVHRAWLDDLMVGEPRPGSGQPAAGKRSLGDVVEQAAVTERE